MSKWHDLTTAEGLGALRREMLVHVSLFGAVTTEILWDAHGFAKGERVVATLEQAATVAKVLADIEESLRAQREGTK